MTTWRSWIRSSVATSLIRFGFGALDVSQCVEDLPDVRPARERSSASRHAGLEDDARVRRKGEALTYEPLRSTR